MKAFLLKRLPQLGLLLVIVLMAGFFAARQPLFLTSGTVAQMFKYYSPLAMMALGMTLIILTGGIDLSVGYAMMFVMFVMAGLIRDHPEINPFLAMGAGLIAALLVGTVIGGSVAFARIPAFIISLAVMVAAYGVTLVISQNQSISHLPKALLWLGGESFSVGHEDYPMMLPVVLVAYGLVALLLNRTRFGRHLYAIGSNREAARLSGIPVKRVELTAYLLSAVCVWIAAIMQIGLNRNADPKVALSDSLELNAIAAVVIGGTSLTGGRGGVSGTALGMLLLALLFLGLDLSGIHEPSYKKMIQGGIICLGAVLDAYQRRRANANA
ncbi:MAG TPA: ABC transporter permease [Chthonomonadaceae bacterium]|nr:ABC transporter permease [Chthonomonadaceae bacterium]